MPALPSGSDARRWRLAGIIQYGQPGLTFIEDGGLDDKGDVAALAERVGVGERHLRRLFREHLGASPVAVAQTRRVHLAKQLLHETRLPMGEVALASGFGSIRRFNETFQTLFGRGPSSLRRMAGSEITAASAGGVTVRLRYRAPYDWPAMLSFLAARAIPGVELVEDGAYSRAIDLGGAVGSVEVAQARDEDALIAHIRFPVLSRLPAIIAGLRRVFDLAADPEAINEHLPRDASLAPLIAARPGLRAPGGWDGFELAVRAILGQQITVSAAIGLAGNATAKRHLRRRRATCV